MPYYLGYTPSNRREIFHLSQRPSRENTNGRYKRCRGPLTLIGAHYLQYREENGYPVLPIGTTAADLEALAAEDQDFYWQALWLVLTIPAEELARYQEDEALEFNPDFAPVT
jgi:hypothetical protein